MRDGHVECRAHERDGRSKRVMLTPAGFDKMQETCTLWQTAQAEAVLDTEKALALREALADLSSDGRRLREMRRATRRVEDCAFDRSRQSFRRAGDEE